MKKTITYFMLLVFVGCSSISVSYDYDKNADFNKYKTYAYDESADKLPIMQLDKDRLTAAVDRELKARGFTKSDTPDILVGLHVRTQQGQTATATTTGTGMYGGPWRYGYGGGFTTTSVNVENYTDGTLFINLIDKAQDKIVWQGRGTKTLDENASPEKKESNINKAVTAIFQKYPVKPAGK